MGVFNKLFKSDCEGLVEAYLQTYKKIKNTPQFRAAAESFEEDTKMPREFHYANTAINSRRYNQYQLEKVMGLFMENINNYVESNNNLNENQIIISFLKAAHHIEAGKDINYNFEIIANKYISQYFNESDLSKNLDIQSLKEVLSEVS